MANLSSTYLYYMKCTPVTSLVPFCYDKTEYGLVFRKKKKNMENIKNEASHCESKNL